MKVNDSKKVIQLLKENGTDGVYDHMIVYDYDCFGTLIRKASIVKSVRENENYTVIVTENDNLVWSKISETFGAKDRVLEVYRRVIDFGYLRLYSSDVSDL
jgi:hypothetical protein